MNQSIEFKAIPGQFNIDEAQGMVECFVAGIGNKDSVGDVLISGAFTKSLTRRKPRVVWGHNWNDPIGKVLEIYEVAPGDRRLPSKMLTAGIGGLYAKVQFNLNSEKGREAFANVAFFGQEQEWSIGYKTLDSIFDPSLQANILKEVELYEVSPVLHGANQLTGTISVKSDELSMTDDAKGGMMVVGMGGQMPNREMHRQHERRTPNILEANKPGIGDEKRNQLEIELAVRAGAPVKVRVADENMVVFDRMTPDGAPTTYRVAYHNTGREFMFGKPERVAVQTVYVPSEEESGSRVVIPSQMPSMPMHVKPEGNAYTGDDQNEYQNIMPKSYDNDEKWVFDEDFADLANIISDSLDLKVGRALSAKNMSKLKAILESLHDVVSSADKEVEVKTDYIIPVQIENAFETKQLLDPIFDYHRVESHVTEDGIVVTSGVTQDFMDAIGVAEKALGQRLGGGLGKLGRAARGAANFDPKAWDGDGDGLVQEGTPYQRPAVPGVNDRSTGGRVNADAATRAFRQQGGKPADSKKPSGGLASSGRPEPIKKQGEFFGSPVYDEFNGQYVEGEVIALSDLYGDDRPGYAIVGRYDMDGQGTVGYFYGGDDEEFETIEDAMDFLENIEKEGEEDRFYDDAEFRGVDRKRSAGRPGERPLSGLASSSKKFDVNDRAQRVEKITEMYMNGSTVPDISQYFSSLNPSDRRVVVLANIENIIDKQRKNGIIPLRSNMPNRITKKQRERDKEILRLWNEGELEPREIAKFAGTNVTNVYGVIRRSRLANESTVRRGDRERGLASSSVEKKPEVIRGEIVRGPGSVTPATKRVDKAVERGVVAPEHAEIIRDILSDLTPENIKDGEGGDILGEIRRKFVKAVQSGKFDNYKDATVQEDSLDNYIDYQLKDLISNALSDTLEANINRRYASKKENDVYDEIRDEVVSEFTDNLSNAIKVSNKNKPPSDKDVAAAKDNARKKLSELIGDLEEGGEESEITSQELYEIVREIVADDPSVDVADMFRLLERAAEDGYATNPDNYELEKLYDELKGQSQNKGTLEEFEELKLDSEYLPERIEARRTLAGGLASTGRMRDEDNFDEYDEAFGPVTRGARRGMSDDPVGDAASENIDRDRNASAVRSGLASTVRGEGTMLARDGQIRRDERGNVDPTEAREARAAFDQNIFNKLRELGFNDDDIEKLTGVADGGRVPEGAKPAQYVPDDIGKGGLASESRVPGKLSSRSALQRVNRQPSKNGTQVLDNAILMDFLSGMSAKEVDEKYSLGGPSFAYNAANREFGRLRRNSDSRANSDMDLLMYRASGLSVNDASDLFRMSPREVRKTEKRLQAKLKDNIEDDDLLYLRSGLSLEQAGKVLGVEPQKLRQMEQAASRRKAEKIEKAKGTGGPASGGRDTDKREMDMTLAEYAELDEVLKKYMDESQLDGVGADEDMQIIQNILDKIDESSDANDSIPLTDKEIDDYIDTLTRMKDNGPVEDDGDKESITKLIDSLKKTKESSDKYYGSDALKESGTRISPVTDAQKRTAKNVRAFRSASGTINPHKKLDIELTEDEIGLLRDEVESLSLTAENKNIFNSIREKLEKAKNGKFSVDDTEYEETIKAIEQSKSRSGAVSSDLLGVLEQAAETDDGKFSSLNLRGGGLASTNNGKKPNNGAPPDITEAMQKDYIFWARSANARNLRLVQDALREFEKNDGQLPPSKWQRLRTMYTNMGPGSAKGGRRGIFGRGKGGTTEKPSSSGPGFVIGRGDAVQKGITVDVPSTPLVTDGFEKIGGQGGSQPGGKFKDPNTGTEYYIKEPKTKLHAENESLVSMLYQKLGVGVGKVRVGERQGKPKIVSEWLPGSKEVSHGREIQNPAWKKSVQDGFVADAWLANWDATGNPDNIKMGSDGKAYRVDTGGGLFFRARGAEKGSAFGPIVGEMETLRDPRMNSLGASYFGDIPPEEIAKQVAAVGSISDGEIRKMVEGIVTDKSKAKELSDILIARRDYLVKNWSTGKNTGGGRRARTSGLASSDDYSRRPKQSGVPGAMRPADFEVRGEDGGGGKGSAMGAEGTKFAGLSLDEAKPGNWDELSNDEKLDWLMYEGNPKKVAEKGQRMSLAAHEGAIKKVSQDIEREERRSMTPAQRREARIAEQDSLSEVELERQNTERKKRQEEQEKPQKPQKTYKPKENAEEAKKQRTDELQDYQDKIEDIKRRLGGLDYEGDFNPSAEDIWETVYALLGDEDITKRSISDAVSSLEDYIETNSPGENRYEKLSISSAKTLLKQLDKTSSKYENDPWIIDDKPVSGLASRAKDGDRPRPGSSEMPQSNAKRENEMKKIIDLAQQVIDDMKSNQNSVQGRRARVGGLASSSGPKAMITDEATFFKDIETSLQKEIRAAQKAKNRDAVNGLSKLQEIITRNEASKTGSRRTNVGSIYLTADEADMVLNGLMFALDSQIELGGDKRIEWYSKLLEKVSKAAMSTFINKNT